MRLSYANRSFSLLFVSLGVREKEAQSCRNDGFPQNPAFGSVCLVYSASVGGEEGKILFRATRGWPEGAISSKGLS